MVGDVVEVPFPFTDFTGDKIRPAVVLADVGEAVTGSCAELTTRPQSRPGDIPVTRQDMQSGRLRHDSWARVRPRPIPSQQRIPRHLRPPYRRQARRNPANRPKPVLTRPAPPNPPRIV